MYDLICYNTDDNIIDKLWQWDSDRILIVKDIETTENIVFHFGNRKNKTTLKVTPTINQNNDLEVKIPNCLLRQPYPIQVYLYEGTAEEDESEGQTIYMTQLPVRERPEPDSIEYEDIEDHIDYLRELVDRAQTLESELSKDIENAENSIDNLNAKISEFTSAADALSARIDDEIALIESKFATAIADKDQLDADIKSIFDNANSSKTSLVGEITQSITEAQTIKTELDLAVENGTLLLASLKEENSIASDNITYLQNLLVNVPHLTVVGFEFIKEVDE